LNCEQQAFLSDEFFSMTLMAVARHGNLYRKGSSEPLRDAFRRSLHSWLERVAEQYRAPVSEDTHLTQIKTLADEMSSGHADALYGGRFRIGSTQKALNLYLKYMWCLGRIPAPPHCPFDSVVLSQLPGCQNKRWTQLGSTPKLLAAAGTL
jgi:hypothetical protein